MLWYYPIFLFLDTYNSAYLEYLGCSQTVGTLARHCHWCYSYIINFGLSPLLGPHAVKVHYGVWNESFRLWILQCVRVYVKKARADAIFLCVLRVCLLRCVFDRFERRKRSAYQSCSGRVTNRRAPRRSHSRG